MPVMHPTDPIDLDGAWIPLIPWDMSCVRSLDRWAWRIFRKVHRPPKRVSRAGGRGTGRGGHGQAPVLKCIRQIYTIYVLFVYKYIYIDTCAYIIPYIYIYIYTHLHIFCTYMCTCFFHEDTLHMIVLKYLCICFDLVCISRVAEIRVYLYELPVLPGIELMQSLLVTRCFWILKGCSSVLFVTRATLQNCFIKSFS